MVQQQVVSHSGAEHGKQANSATNHHENTKQNTGLLMSTSLRLPARAQCKKKQNKHKTNEDRE